VSCYIQNSDGTEEYLGEWSSVEEGLEELRSEGYGVVLDITRVPSHLKNDPRLLEFELLVAVHMRDEAYRAAVCLHEAAHAEYNERMGADYVSMHGSYVFCKENGELTYANAHVMGKHEDEEITADMLDYVKSVVAAGIAEEVMTGRPTGGTGLDDAKLQVDFDKNGVSIEERKKCLDQARTDILKDLRSPAFREGLWKRAKFYQRILEQAIYRNNVPVPEERRQAA
jgi:hypothetical protein